MPDMLVKLYELPDLQHLVDRLERKGVTIRHAMPYEKHTVVEWVRDTFSAGWGSECEVCFGNQPVSCFIATKEGRILGFACHDCTCRNFFGPMGVAEEARGQGIGKVLFLACLHAMREQGYAYAIVGGAGPTKFYTEAAGATVIEGSEPGIYVDFLEEKD